MRYLTRTIIEIADDQIVLTQTAQRDANRIVKQYIATAIENPSEQAVGVKLAVLNKTHHLNLASSENVLVVSRQHVILRYLNLPSQNPAELRQMVGLQAANHIPYDPEDVVIDFTVLVSDHEGYSRVLVIIVPKEVVLRLAKIMEAAKLPMARITMSSVGIFDWYKACAPRDDAMAVVLNLYRRDSEICICNRDYLFTSRHVSMGLDDLDASRYDDFIKQIDLTVGSYNKERLGPAVKRIAVLTSFESLPEFTERLNKEYDMPVELIRTIKNQPDSAGHFHWPEAVLAQGASLAIGLGLGLGKEPGSIDLTPPQITQARYNKKFGASVIRLSIAGVAALMTLVFALNLGAMSKHWYLKDLETQLKSVKAKVSQAEKKTAQINTLKTVLEQRVVLLDVIDELYRLMPAGISLVNLNVSNGRKFSLQGISQQGGEINMLQSALVNSSMFRNVSLDYVNKRVSQEGEVNYFKITCEIGKTNP